MWYFLQWKVMGQMNYGVKMHANVYFFLHADSEPTASILM
jgi:hypothetical protein